MLTTPLFDLNQQLARDVNQKPEIRFTV